METLLIKDGLDRAAKLIKAGQLVAVPTETVYGLACNGLDERAVADIYEVKGRTPIKPLSLMVGGAEDMERYCLDIPAAAYTLAKKYWPGPLTIVLKAKNSVPEIVRAGGSTVGLRCPDHPMTQELLKLSDLPFAAPSANPSGQPSPKNADKVMEYFDGKIAAVLDGGDCGIGKESTLIDMSSTPYKVLRESALSCKELAATLAEEMKIVGITGGSGCGKTTALGELEKLGALIIDCDALYHSLLKENDELKNELFAAFPGCERDGAVDRKALGLVVFNDGEALKRLNAITHRHIGLAVESLIEKHAMNGGSLAAIDAVELISSGISKRCDLLVGISADKDVRIRRIMARDGIDYEAARLRIDAQRPDSYYKENCHAVIANNGDVDKFINEFKNILQEALKWTN